MKTSRRTRYQAAILRDDEILLIKHREHANGYAYWLLPGGGIEKGETEIECVVREVWEETNLKVSVNGLLLDEIIPHKEGMTYQRFKTYLCHPLTNDASPGYEPEPEAAAIYVIKEVGWFSIKDEATWNDLIVNDVITVSALRRLREALEKERGS